jgi:predicted kinase
MSDPCFANPPALIIVTGRPGSGKTTLVHTLARSLHCPAICRDEFKEGYVNTLGSLENPGHDIPLNVYHAFFETIELMVKHRITLVAEAAFQHKRWAPMLEPLMEIACIRIVVCEIDAALAQRRQIDRANADPIRGRFHEDPVVQAAREKRELPDEEYDPPRLNVPILKVDTTDGYRPGLLEIVTFAGGPPVQSRLQA